MKDEEVRESGGADDAQPEGLEPNARRDFLIRLGKMTFLTAAVTKFGGVSRGDDTIEVDPDTICTNKTLIDGGEGEVQDVVVVVEDKDCGKKSSPTSPFVASDNDCRTSLNDNDCGKRSPNSTAAPAYWSDQGCSTKAGITDADCGDATASYPLIPAGTWTDNDCQKGGSDNDCGKKTVKGGTHDDSDGKK